MKLGGGTGIVCGAFVASGPGQLINTESNMKSTVLEMVIPLR